MGVSIQDKVFLRILDQTTLSKNPQGNLEASLPFLSSKPKLQNSRFRVPRRAKSEDFTLQNHDVERGHTLKKFMQKMFDNNHSEIARLRPLCYMEKKAAAAYGLQKIAQEHYESDVLDFVNRNFYFDDGLMSLLTSSKAHKKNTGNIAKRMINTIT
ncbi:unnamed protein product [Mytilus edulis]|uniref:Uncharacterized protein n=1 Tax=Mytilus edulis TaxID=6550 RepID=A0A8S3V0X5_MYTED|nr:unnamed protein product [Mytilus edulis]